MTTVKERTATTTDNVATGTITISKGSFAPNSKVSLKLSSGEGGSSSFIWTCGVLSSSSIPAGISFPSEGLGSMIPLQQLSINSTEITIMMSQSMQDDLVFSITVYSDAAKDKRASFQLALTCNSSNLI